MTTKTLRNWDEVGKLNVVRSPGNHRLIAMEEIARIQGLKLEQRGKIKTLIYARCSTGKQKDNLERQLNRLEQWCQARNKDYEVYSEIGSGLNGSRKEVCKLIDRMSKGDVKELVIEYKDRLTRVGYTYFEAFCKAFEVEIICLEQETEETFEEAMVADVMGTILSYSARMNGRRGAENKKKKRG